MSSFNVHRNKLLVKNEPINHRFSHLQSCLNKVANLIGCSRADLIQELITEINIDVNSSDQAKDLECAFEYLLKVRKRHLSN